MAQGDNVTSGGYVYRQDQNTPTPTSSNDRTPSNVYGLWNR